jgi:platelet-activating factor acetylhydrolase
VDGFQLETVLFSIYYPAPDGAEATKPNRTWVPRPIDLVARGLSTYLNSNGSPTSPQLIGIGLQALAGNIQIPAAVDVPLTDTDGKLPVLVFSHGDATLRTWYSQYCGELASRGYVTVAIEHRDGSGPGTYVLREDGSRKNVTYITPEQLS